MDVTTDREVNILGKILSMCAFKKEHCQVLLLNKKLPLNNKNR